MKHSCISTPVQMLVVILIFFILLAVMFPAVHVGPGYSPKADASNDVTQIANATLAYQSEYGVWPPNSGSTPSLVSGAFLQALMGNNPRHIAFLEVSPWKKGYGGVTSNAYEDPWGNIYQFVVDIGNEGSVSNLPLWFGTTTIQKTVAVWMQANSTYTGSGRMPATSW